MKLSKFQIQSSSPHPYRLGFTAGALGISQCQILATLKVKLGSWNAVRQEVLAENRLFRARRSSLLRTEWEFRQRVQTLTDSQIALLAQSTADVARFVALLAAFKRYAFLFDFCCLGLRPKIEWHDLAFRPLDYENFVAEAKPSHPELTALPPSSRAKVRQLTHRIPRGGRATFGEAATDHRRPQFALGFFPGRKGGHAS